MSFSLSSAPKGVFAIVLAAALAGCGSKDSRQQYEAAKEAFELRDYAKADKLLEKLLENSPGNADALVLKTQVKLAIGELADAAEAIRRASEIAGGDADVRMLDAQIAWHSKDYKRAADLFTAMALDMKLPADVRSQALSGLGIVEMTCNNSHLSRIAFLKAIRVDRRNPAAWYHLGLLYRDGFGYNDAALEQFQIFVRLNENADLRVQKVQKSVMPALKEMIQNYASSRPGASSRDSAAAAAAISAAQSAAKKGAWKTAKAQYEKALKADPLSHPAALGLSRAWAKTDTSKLGRQKRLEYMQMACQLNPYAVAVYLETGALALQLGHFGSAVEIYSRALAAAPSNIEAIDGLIRALRKTGKNSIAKAYQSYRDMIAAKRK